MTLSAAGEAPPATRPADPPRPAAYRRGQLAAIAILAGAAFAISPWATPQTALAAGIILALLALVPRDLPAQDLARFLIQVSVVLLGFTMDLSQVLRAGAGGIIFAGATILATFALGALIRRWLAIDRAISVLISSGTAICGGSAIAAVGATIGAPGAAIAISMAVIFILNGAALYIFPPLGHALGLTPEQFGAWAGVAIHDISSVVGAAAQFDHAHQTAIASFPAPSALPTATAVKLSRVLWIVPVCLLAARLVRPGNPPHPRAAPPAIPWFILLFLAAAILHTLIPQIRDATAQAVATSRIQMRLALFLIGTGLSIPALRTVGWRPLLQGILLWGFISLAALAVVKAAV
jgi:uncharacterized integral membrane protein (TIGR00698 family)